MLDWVSVSIVTAPSQGFVQLVFFSFSCKGMFVEGVSSFSVFVLFTSEIFRLFPFLFTLMINDE